MLWLSLELTIAWINRRSWNHVVLLINKRRRFDILGHPGFFERVPSVDSSPQCFWFWGIFIYHNNVPKQRWTKSSWDVKVPFVILRCQMYPNVSKKCFQQGGEYIYIYTCMYVCINYIYIYVTCLFFKARLAKGFSIHKNSRKCFVFETSDESWRTYYTKIIVEMGEPWTSVTVCQNPLWDCQGTVRSCETEQLAAQHGGVRVRW